MNSAIVLLAAGSSSRMGRDKMGLSLLGKSPLEHCLGAVDAMKEPFEQIVVTCREGDGAAQKALQDGLRGWKNLRVVPGACTRGGSVYLGLKALGGAELVLIHDAARCLVSPALLTACLESARERGSGIAALPARDTVFHRERGPLDREKLLLTQTPQAFRYEDIRRAYELAAVTGAEATDDCGIYRAAGFSPCFVQGELTNQKLTYPEDIPFFEAVLRSRAV